METAKYDGFIPVNFAPLGTTEISVYNSDGKRVGGFLPQKLRLPRLGEKLYSCGVLSDVHITGTASNAISKNFQNALKYLNETECVNSIFICGDLTQNGTLDELQAYKNYVGTYSPNVPVYAITGNHEYKTTFDVANRISEYTGQPLYYTVKQGDDVFIMLGIASATKGSLFADGELQWFYERLEENRNKRCFVFTHVFPPSKKDADGKLNPKRCGNALELYHTDLWGDDEQTIFESLLYRYPNVILFHGHSHFKFGMQEFDKTANYGKDFKGHSVHIPSVSMPTYNSGSIESQKYEYDYNASEGYVMDVYRNHIILKGMDFKNGKYLPIAHYCLDTTIKKVGVGTYVDSTGTIKT